MDGRLFKLQLNLHEYTFLVAANKEGICIFFNAVFIISFDHTHSQIIIMILIIAELMVLVMQLILCFGE